jgi:threonine dehydrogenase-like Zn-dependent dehydrogenase
MKALVWEAPRQVVMRNQAEPIAARDEVVLRVMFAGICGSELSGYLGHNALRVPPLVMGHEFSGEIIALGDNVENLSALTCPGRMPS